MHDDLISDILGGADPLSFGFSAKSDASLSLEMTNTAGTGPYAAGLGGRPVHGAGTAGVAGTARDPAFVSRTSSGETSGLPGAPRRLQHSGAALPQQHPHHATPAVLKKFRNSAIWSTLTHGYNYDVHQVRLPKPWWRFGAAWSQQWCSSVEHACLHCDDISESLRHLSCRAITPVQVLGTDERIAAIPLSSSRLSTAQSFMHSIRSLCRWWTLTSASWPFSKMQQ